MDDWSVVSQSPAPPPSGDGAWNVVSEKPANDIVEAKHTSPAVDAGMREMAKMPAGTSDDDMRAAFARGAQSTVGSNVQMGGGSTPAHEWSVVKETPAASSAPVAAVAASPPRGIPTGTVGDISAHPSDALTPDETTAGGHYVGDIRAPIFVPGPGNGTGPFDHSLGPGGTGGALGVMSSVAGIPEFASKVIAGGLGALNVRGGANPAQDWVFKNVTQPLSDARAQMEQEGMKASPTGYKTGDLLGTLGQFITGEGEAKTLAEPVANTIAKITQNPKVQATIANTLSHAAGNVPIAASIAAEHQSNTADAQSPTASLADIEHSAEVGLPLETLANLVPMGMRGNLLKRMVTGGLTQQALSAGQQEAQHVAAPALNQAPSLPDLADPSTYLGAALAAISGHGKMGDAMAEMPPEQLKATAKAPNTPLPLRAATVMELAQRGDTSLVPGFQPAQPARVPYVPPAGVATQQQSGDPAAPTPPPVTAPLFTTTEPAHVQPAVEPVPAAVAQPIAESGQPANATPQRPAVEPVGDVRQPVPGADDAGHTGTNAGGEVAGAASGGSTEADVAAHAAQREALVKVYDAAPEPAKDAIARAIVEHDKAAPVVAAKVETPAIDQSKVAPVAPVTDEPVVAPADPLTRAEAITKAKELGLPATGKTADIANLVRIAQAHPKDWTRDDFNAISPHLAIHQDMRGNHTDETVQQIMQNGVRKGMVDSVGTMAGRSGGRTYAKGLTGGDGYVFLNGKLKYRGPTDPHLAEGNIPLFHVRGEKGQDVFDAIHATARTPEDVAASPRAAEPLEAATDVPATPADGTGERLSGSADGGKVSDSTGETPSQKPAPEPAQETPRAAAADGIKPVASDAPTSVKNAVTEAEADRDGVDRVMSESGSTDKETWDNAKPAAAKDSQAGRRLAADIIAKPRSISSDESALLLHDRVRIHNELGVARAEAASTEGKSDAQKAGDLLRVTDLEQQRRDNDQAARASGTEWSNSGRARQMLANKDYSLETLRQRAEVAAGGHENVTEKMKAELDQHAKTIAELNERLAKAEAARAEAAKPSKERAPKGPPKTMDEKAQERIKKEIEKLEGAIRARLSACPV